MPLDRRPRWVWVRYPFGARYTSMRKGLRVGRGDSGCHAVGDVLEEVLDCWVRQVGPVAKDSVAGWWLRPPWVLVRTTPRGWPGNSPGQVRATNPRKLRRSTTGLVSPSESQSRRRSSAQVGRFQNSAVLWSLRP